MLGDDVGFPLDPELETGPAFGVVLGLLVDVGAGTTEI
jgi:hypothetical protein